MSSRIRCDPRTGLEGSESSPFAPRASAPSRSRPSPNDALPILGVDGGVLSPRGCLDNCVLVGESTALSRAVIVGVGVYEVSARRSTRARVPPTVGRVRSVAPSLSTIFSFFPSTNAILVAAYRGPVIQRSTSCSRCVSRTSLAPPESRRIESRSACARTPSRSACFPGPIRAV